MHIQERRIAKRFPLNLSGYAVVKGNSVDMRTHDISQGGALVEFVTHASFRSGTKLLVRLGIGFMGRAVICRIITRDNCVLYSLKFDRFDFYSDLILIAYLFKYEHHLPGGSSIH